MFTPHHVSCVMCHVSCVTCHMSRVTCHMSHVFLFLFLLFFVFFYPTKNMPKWWSQLVEGLISTGPTPSSLRKLCYFRFCAGIFLACSEDEKKLFFISANSLPKISQIYPFTEAPTKSTQPAKLAYGRKISTVAIFFKKVIKKIMGADILGGNPPLSIVPSILKAICIGQGCIGSQIIVVKVGSYATL